MVLGRVLCGVRWLKAACLYFLSDGPGQFGGLIFGRAWPDELCSCARVWVQRGASAREPFALQFCLSRCVDCQA